MSKREQKTRATVLAKNQSPECNGADRGIELVQHDSGRMANEHAAAHEMEFPCNGWWTEKMGH